MMQRLERYALWAVVLLSLCLTTYFVFFHRGANTGANTKTFTPAPEIKKVEDVKKVVIQVQQVKALEKTEVVKKLELPPEIADDVKEQVTATATVEPYKGKTDVVSVLDTETGETREIVKQEKIPLFGFPNEKELGIRGGYAFRNSNNMLNLGLEADVFGRWTLVRIGNVYGALYGEINTKPEGKTMIELSYRF